MTNKYALITLLLSLTLFTARGQSNVEVSLESNPNGYTINKNPVGGTSGTFVIKGTYDNTKSPIALERAVIVIKEDVEQDITLILDGVTIDVSKLTVTGGTAYCPIDASKFKYQLTLLLKGESLLKAGHNRPAISVPSVANSIGKLVIEDDVDGNGILNAIGGANCPAIGSKYNLDHEGGESKYFGNIIIRSGTINARGGNLAAAIGSSYFTGGGTVTIEGGHVTATGDNVNFETTGIGNGGHNISGNFITGGTVRITGGVVEALGTGGYPGIGTGTNCLGGTVEISGGTVTAMGSDRGLKNMGIDGKDLTFNATGNAFILTDGIQPQENKKIWKGVIFENNEGSVYTGEPQSQSLEITTDATIPDTVTLTIPEGTTLTIPSSVTLENDGTIHNNGTINGSIKGKAIQHGVMFYSNYKGASPEYTITYVTTGDPAPVTSETRTLEYYTFEGWFNQPDGGTEVTSLNVVAPTKLYAHWNMNVIRPVNSVPSLTGSYGDPLDFDLAELIADDSYKNGLTYEFDDPSAERYGLEIQGEIPNQRLTGTPDKVTTGATTIRIKISSKDCENPVSPDIPVSIDQRPLTITPFPDQLIYQGEGPTFTVGNGLANEEPAFSGQLGVDPATSIITLGTLALENNDAFLASNYKLALQTGIACTYTDQPAFEIESQPTGTKHGDWYAGPVTFAAPDGFTIKLKEATPATGTTTTKAVETPAAMGINTKALSGELRASGEDFAASFTFEQEGMYDVSYLLRRDAPYNQEYGHTQQSVFVDLNAPVVNVSTSYQSYTLTATDGKGSGIASVLIDNSPVQLNAAGSYYGYGSEGSHSYKVTDNVGHTTEGIIPDSPVSIDQISDGKSRIYAFAGVLHIETATPQRMLISTMGGKVIRHSSLPAGSNRVYGLPNGFYIVRLSDGTTVKVWMSR